MGLFDWLFGKKKKDPYGGGALKKDYASPHETPPHEREPYIEAPSKKRKHSFRTAGLSWRRRRSKHPVEPIPEQTIHWDPWSGKSDFSAVFGGRGGKRARTGSPDRVEALGLPNLESLDELAGLLGSTPNDLLQYLVRSGMEDNHHYIARRIPKKSGQERLLVVPKPRLKALQRRLYEKLVRKLPLNESVHGFRNGRDVLSGASVHVGREVVIGLDIVDFFPSFDFRRVSGYFRSIGYPRGVAVSLANLTTVRPGELPGVQWSGLNWKPQLPQGAPTSPGIANAICWRMDKRLGALARKFGGDYTRYADDLTFSGHGDMARNAEKLVEIVREIVKSEGLALNEKKTRIMRKGRQQRVTGVVVNEKTNVSRREFDQLKAILHNCVKHGPDSQNRDGHEDWEGHLRGRIAHVSHIGPERGAKLQRMFDQIRW